jgi:hypothetical protein
MHRPRLISATAGSNEDEPTESRPGKRQLSTRNTARTWFLIVIAEIVLYVVLDAIAQSLPPHYSPISVAESDLAVGPYGYIMTINFLNRGVLSLLFLFALQRTMGFGSTGAVKLSRGSTMVFGVWAVGAILLAFFPTDVPATPVSWHGTVHLVVALLAFFGGAIGAVLLSLQMKKSEALRGASSAALALAVISVLALLMMFVLTRSDIGGLTERIFLGSVLLWIGFVSSYSLWKK